MLSFQLRKILLLCPGSNNVEANEENYQKQWTAGPMDSNFFAVIFVSVLRMTKYSPVLHRKSKPKTYLNINEGQATSFPGTLRTWCELQIICIVFINTDTQYFDIYVPRTRHQTNIFRPPVCASCRKFTASPQVKWWVNLPPSPLPPFQRCQKWRVLDELIIESGEGWVCFSFYSKQGCKMERNPLPFVCLKHKHQSIQPKATLWGNKLVSPGCEWNVFWWGGGCL